MRVCVATALSIADFAAPDATLRAYASYSGTQLGVLCLGGSLRAGGHEPALLDFNRICLEKLTESEKGLGPASDLMLEAYVAGLLDAKADLYGLSTLCSSYPQTIRIAKRLKEVRPDAIVVLGGPQATVVDKETLGVFPWIDFVLGGEADETFPLLADRLEKMSAEAIESIPGLTYRSQSRIVRNPPAPPILELDTLPLPAFDLDPGMKDRTSVHLEIGRGCPYTCTFCSTNDFFRKSFRLKSTPRMLEEMAEVADTYGVSDFSLVHDMYTIDRRRVVEFCEALLESGKSYKWSCSARTDRVDNDLLRLMAEAGCSGIFFGIESGSPDLQHTTRKNLDLADARKRIRAATSRGISTAVALICGFPDETRNDLRQTTDYFVDALRFDLAEPQISLLAPLARTPLTDCYRKQLVYDGVYSDMSHQGWKRSERDEELIREHPDVFVNFYAIPTATSREYLNEIRDILTASTVWFRWLTVALLDTIGSFLEVFDRWLAWSRQNGVTARDGSYYFSGDFVHAFLKFVSELLEELRPSSAARRVLETIWQYESLLASDQIPRGADAEAPQKAREAGPSIVRRHRKAVVKELPADLKAILEALREGRGLGSVSTEPGRFGFVAGGNGKVTVLRLSEAAEQLLALCGEERAVEDLIEEIAEASLERASLDRQGARKRAAAGIMQLVDDRLLEVA